MRISAWFLCLITALAVATTAEAQPGGGRGGRGGGGMFGRGGIFGLVTNEAVQKDLGLSTDEAAKTKTVADDFNTAFREAMGDSGGRRGFQDPEVRAKMRETAKVTTEKFLPKLKDVLTAAQFTRLQQISWQAMGTEALSEPEVIKALPIATEQQEKIKTVNTEYDTKQQELFAAAFGGGGGGDREAMREKIQTLTKERETKVNELLTKDQLDKFASLKGKEFDLTQLRGGPGGGGGGGAGGGGRPKRPQPKAE